MDDDTDPDKATQADAAKLVTNSLHGKTTTNKDDHRGILYCGVKGASKLANDKRFQNMEPLNDEPEVAEEDVVYEVEMKIGSNKFQSTHTNRLFCLSVSQA